SLHDYRSLHSFPTRRSSDLSSFGVTLFLPMLPPIRTCPLPLGFFLRRSTASATPPLLKPIRLISPPSSLSLNSLFLGFPSCGFGDRKSTRLNSSHVKISYAV